MKFLSFITFFIVFAIQLFGDNIEGYVYSDEEHNKQRPLEGALVFWLNSSVIVTTDKNGYFSLETNPTSEILIVSFSGYQTDTLKVENYKKALQIKLIKDNTIEEIVVEGNNSAQINSAISVFQKQIITESGLNKLPCCNLSESFENNATVDVNYSDAISGAKQIKMLGLEGKYSQILRENMPTVRGLSAAYGLTYFPGTWLESIQISKGASIVINGFESTTGQINLELRKPDKSDRLIFNLYGNSEGKIETNLTTTYKINENISTGLLVHASNYSFMMDQNGDGFADMPIMTQLNFMNRWKFRTKNNAEGQIGIRFLLDKKEGGQIDYLQDRENINAYGIGIDVKQYEVFGKYGFVIPNTELASLGSMFSVSRHEQRSFFGDKTYFGIQNSIYLNVIFQTMIKSEQNIINFGGSFMYDDYIEQFNTVDYSRREIIPGMFVQYTFNLPDKFSVISGVRADYHNLYGLLFTPRLHAKFNIDENRAIRASVGKAYRTANIFAENQSIFSSSRVLVIEEEFKPEEAWNYGINFSWKIPFSKKREVGFGMDYFRTDFVNQLVGDINADVHEIRFYNLRGESYSNSFQAELNIQPIKKIDIFAAFRVNDVHITMNNNLIESPYVNRYKGLVTLSYATKYKKWMFDVTNQFNGRSTLPDFSGNPVEFRWSEKSPAYYILHAQITRKFKRFEVYGGAENLTDYRQKTLIIDPENPFGEHFDASVIWGPVSGRKFYAGLRLRIE
jgi:outer membrane receptor for ferrienterochelin and colicins